MIRGTMKALIVAIACLCFSGCMTQVRHATCYSGGKAYYDGKVSVIVDNTGLPASSWLARKDGGYVSGNCVVGQPEKQ